MKISRELLSIALLVSVAQLSAGCSGACSKDTTTTKKSKKSTETTKDTRCAEGCATDEDGNCICDEKCGCNKPTKSEAKRDAEADEEIVVCEDCEQEVDDQGKCGCNKPK